jgi:hypothetical protein
LVRRALRDHRGPAFPPLRRGFRLVELEICSIVASRAAAGRRSPSHRRLKQRLRLLERRLARRLFGKATPEGILALLAQIAELVIGFLVDLIQAKFLVSQFRPLVVVRAGTFTFTPPIRTYPGAAFLTEIKSPADRVARAECGLVKVQK